MKKKILKKLNYQILIIYTFKSFFIYKFKQFKLSNRFQASPEKNTLLKAKHIHFPFALNLAFFFFFSDYRHLFVKHLKKFMIY